MSKWIFAVLVWVVVSPAAELPKDIKWETNEKIEPFGSKEAKRGGVFKTYMAAYPLTFRLWGPNSNDGFAYWNRKNCMSGDTYSGFGLVETHPVTFEKVPVLATHWAVMPDLKTVYYKLRKEVKFSDGKPVTADHYVFTYEMMLSEHIKDPFYNKYFREQYESVEKVDDHTIKIVGKYPSWRALDLYQVYPIAKHSFKLDKNWVKANQWKPPVCVGPYRIWKEKKGRYVRFKRVENWWGDSLPFFQGRFNFDVLDLKVIRDRKIAFEHFKKGDLSQYQVLTSSVWSTETDFEAVKKGWVKKRQVAIKKPEIKYGLVMNLQKPIFQNKTFRKSLQHLMDFDKINKNLMYGAYLRLNSFFGGTEYEHPNLKSYPYSQETAAKLLKEAGFTKRGDDGILINAKGERAAFTLTYGSGGLTRHLSVIKEDFKEAGVEMNLRLVDSAKAFADGLAKNFEMLMFGRGAGFYPAPEQYLHSDYAKKTDTNNVFGFADPKVDKLIEVYKKDLDKKKRLKAMHEIEEIVKEEAFYIPFWGAPYVRLLSWANIGHIPGFEPPYTGGLGYWDTYWFEKEKDKQLKAAMRAKKPMPGVSNETVDVDFWNLMKKGNKPK